MDNIIVKRCKKHGDLALWQVKKEIINDREYLRCHLCKIEKDQRWKENHRDQHIKASVEWKRKNRYRVNEWCREDRLKHPEKYKKWAQLGREKAGILRSIKEVTRIRGIKLEYYYALIGRQDNKCAICNEKEVRKNRAGNIARLSIDHCHKSGNVRALLCHGCNTGIGKFKDDVKLLQKAIDYLIYHGVK